ncbi:hypothetical protein J3A83DRAFT_2173755 [Scleroderma citrinum]
MYLRLRNLEHPKSQIRPQRVAKIFYGILSKAAQFLVARSVSHLRRIPPCVSSVSPHLAGLAESPTRPGFRGFSKWEKQDREAEAMAKIRAKMQEQKKTQTEAGKTSEQPASATTLTVPTITLTPASPSLVEVKMENNSKSTETKVPSSFSFTPVSATTTEPKTGSTSIPTSNTTPGFALPSTSAVSSTLPPNAPQATTNTPTTVSTSPAFSFALPTQPITTTAPTTTTTAPTTSSTSSAIPGFFAKPSTSSASSAIPTTTTTLPFTFSAPSQSQPASGGAVQTTAEAPKAPAFSFANHLRHLLEPQHLLLVVRYLEVPPLLVPLGSSRRWEPPRVLMPLARPCQIPPPKPQSLRLPQTCSPPRLLAPLPQHPALHLQVCLGTPHPTRRCHLHLATLASAHPARPPASPLERRMTRLHLRLLHLAVVCLRSPRFRLAWPRPILRQRLANRLVLPHLGEPTPDRRCRLLLRPSRHSLLRLLQVVLHPYSMGPRPLAQRTHLRPLLEMHRRNLRSHSTLHQPMQRLLLASLPLPPTTQQPQHLALPPQSQHSLSQLGHLGRVLRLL